MQASITALVLSIAASVFSKEPPRQCTGITRQNIRHLQKQRCNVKVKEGRLSALCNMLVEGPSVGYPGGNIRGEGRNVLLMNFQLESDEPVVNMTVKDEPMCLALRKSWVRKRENYQGDVENYVKMYTDQGNIGPFEAMPFFKHIRLMTFNITFRNPPQLAAAICNETNPDGSCLFDVYAFMPSNSECSSPDLRPAPPALKEWFVFISGFNCSLSWIDTLNVTLEGDFYTIPIHLRSFFDLLSVKELICHRCKFSGIGSDVFLVHRGIERVSLFQTPVILIDTRAFHRMQRLKHVSLDGTGLSGIPLAIFTLPYLETFQMSHTDPHYEGNFLYSPSPRPADSNATRLTLKWNKLTTLPNRAFCAFPMLEELALDSSQIEDISGSPFECLKRLKTLSMSDNNIQSLYDKSFRGLQNLVTLNISSNNITYFEGSYILSTLVSLRSLSLAKNSLVKFYLRPPGEIMMEELDIGWNQVEVWKPPLFSRMFKLKKLSLERNHLAHIDNKMLQDIEHVQDVDFSFNKWDCFTCDLKNLQTFLQKQPPKCSKCLTCATPSEVYEYDVRNVPWREGECDPGPPDYYRVYAVPGLISFMVATLLVNVAYRKRWYIMYGLLYLKVNLKGYRRQRHVGSFLWDGFLSYHTSEADWVRDVLLQRLESPPMEFRLCIAERDFIPGMEISENICRAISQSRTSLFVISREFCHSRWCMFELSLAQHALFEGDRPHGLVVIKKNDVEESDMNTLLKYLTKTRTYVQMPPDGSNEALNNLFWLQLQAALQK